MNIGVPSCRCVQSLTYSLIRGRETQRVHVGIWYILKAQRGSHIPILRPKYIPYTYMDPLGEREKEHDL